MPGHRAMRLRTRLLVGFLSIVAIALAIGLFGIVNVGRVNGLLSSVYNEDLLPISELGRAEANALFHVRGAYRLVIETDGEAMREIVSNGLKYKAEYQKQTDLYAKNISDSEEQAARAGEAGKGFAVVASEVRKLAERSQLAAGEITALASRTVRSASRAGETIGRIVPDIKRTADLVQEISSASKEQSLGSEQIGKAMMQLDAVVQQNASASEEMASMAEELSSQAAQLAEAMSFFRLGREGDDAQALLLEAPSAS